MVMDFGIVKAVPLDPSCPAGKIWSWSLELRGRGLWRVVRRSGRIEKLGQLGDRIPRQEASHEHVDRSP